MVAVPGPEIPDTSPDAEIVAMDGALLLHVPPVGEQLTLAVLPMQTDVAPVILSGSACTVTMTDVLHPVNVV